MTDYGRAVDLVGQLGLLALFVALVAAGVVAAVLLVRGRGKGD